LHITEAVMNLKLTPYPRSIPSVFQPTFPTRSPYTVYLPRSKGEKQNS